MNEYMVIIRGHTYLPIKGVAAEYGCCRATVYNILKEIKACDRYKDAWATINDAGDQLVNTLVFEDFLRHRTELKNRNLARRLPPYDPAEVRRQRGEYKAVVTIPQHDTKGQETRDELIDEMQKALECLRKKTG